jgi:hypothetical protein
LRDVESILHFFSEEELERLLTAIAERRSRRGCTPRSAT